MDEKQTPYLYKSGLKLDIQQLSNATDFHDIIHLEEDKIFRNGMMVELKTLLLNKLGNNLFFQFVRSIVPLSICNNERFPKDQKHFFGGKFKLFETACKKKRKTPKIFSEFQEEEFCFFSKEKEIDTPRKKALKRRLSELETTNEELVSVNVELNESTSSLKDELSVLEEELNAKEEDIESVYNNLQILQNEKLSLQQRIRGLKSGIARKINVQASLFPAPSSASSDKHIATDINDICMNDIIIVDNNDNGGIFKGIRYFGGNMHKKSTSGWVNTYVEIAESTKPCSQLVKRKVQQRAKVLSKFSCRIAGSSSNEDRILLFTEMVKANKDLFRNVFEKAGFKLEVLSAEQAINLQSLLRMPTNKVRNLRLCLSKFGANILPSERQVRKVRAPMVSHINEEAVETGFMGLKRTKNDDSVSNCAYLRVRDLNTFIEQIIKRDTSGFHDDERFNNKWWILFSGDKGGNFMKYHLEIINSRKSGSVDNVHIYCMFEAQDSVENMKKVWLPYHSQVKTMYESDFTICGQGVQIFLGGDYHFLDDNMGHQGSSATYPSSVDKVLLSHLQNHANNPHTPVNCPVEKRTLLDYTANYNENLADSRHSHNMHDNGKYHNSVVGPLIFPLISIEQVVPATLHILLGVVLLLYNLLLAKCKQIDNKTGALQMEEEQKMSEDDWKEASLLLVDAEKTLIHHGENIITMTNRFNRYEAVLNGNTAENVKLSNVSDVRKKSKKKTVVEKCQMQYCFVTTHDINVLWVQCDSCDSWLHTMCEGRSSIEELENDGDYICVDCSGIEDRFQIFADKINKLIDEEEELNHEIIRLGAVCDDLKAVYHNVIGSREKALITALESIKVVRQAYHGNVMVGNHCVKVLKNFQVLTNVISDEISYNLFNEIFDIFNDIMTLVMSKRFLTEEEILKLEEQCVEFGQKFPMYFPERNIIRKMHELIFNIPKFVHKYKTIGMLSEQEGESKHASINAEIRPLANVRNASERIRLVLEREELRSRMDKTLLKPLNRLCVTCKEVNVRSFLRAGNDGHRHCTKCFPEFF